MSYAAWFVVKAFVGLILLAVGFAAGRCATETRGAMARPMDCGDEDRERDERAERRRRAYLKLVRREDEGDHN